jgi:hypothetical protein
MNMVSPRARLLNWIFRAAGGGRDTYQPGFAAYEGSSCELNMNPTRLAPADGARRAKR